MASASSGSYEASPASSAPSIASDSSGNAPTTAEKPPDDTSKLRMFLGILRKYVSLMEREADQGLLSHAVPLSTKANAQAFPTSLSSDIPSVDSRKPLQEPRANNTVFSQIYWRCGHCFSTILLTRPAFGADPQPRILELSRPTKYVHCDWRRRRCPR